MIKDLIEIKQLPIIEEQLKTVSKTIDGKIENAKSLVCTEETVKTVKELRASLNKDFKEFETKRKEVKEKVLAPYMQFEEIYKEYITDKFNSADKELKNKIDSVENELKAKKENEIKEYFEEYKIANNIDFIAYEQAKINVTLTASMKSLKAQVKDFIDKIIDDLKLINTQSNKEEILIEYKKDLNVSRAITDVTNRKEQLRRLQEKKINENLENEKKVIQDNLSNLANANISIENINTTQEIKTRIYTIPFKATGTAPQLKGLKDYMEMEGIKYESITSSEDKI